MPNRQQAAPVPNRARSGDGNTARVVVGHKSTLPGWFWGMLGCLSVLGIGFAALLLVANNGLLAGRAAAPSAPATAVAEPSAAPAGAGGPQIEQLAPPNVPPPAAGEVKPRPPAHPIKLARSSAPSHAAAAPAAKPEASAKPEAPAADDAPAAKKAPDQAAPVDDGRVHIHHATASDDDDDDDDN